MNLTTGVRSAAAARRTTSIVLIAWLLAGTLDITAAILYYVGPSPAGSARLLQGIASGVLGARAFDGGAATALLGLALHYLIALIWALILFGAFRIVGVLRRHLVVTGVVYGFIVWCVMNLIVLPLSNVRHTPFEPQAAGIAAIILVLCVGLPMSLVIGRHLRDHGA